MSDYVIVFTAYLDERKRPEGFPRKVKEVLTARFDRLPDLVDFVNKRHQMYIQSKGMGATLDKVDLDRLGITETERVWIPERMIAFTTVVIKNMTGEVPQVDPEGIISMPSGKEIVKN